MRIGTQSCKMGERRWSKYEELKKDREKPAGKHQQVGQENGDKKVFAMQLLRCNQQTSKSRLAKWFRGHSRTSCLLGRGERKARGVRIFTAVGLQAVLTKRAPGFGTHGNFMALQKEHPSKFWRPSNAGWIGTCGMSGRGSFPAKEWVPAPMIRSSHDGCRQLSPTRISRSPISVGW